MKAVRNEYSEIGVENYYLKHSKDYSNPHEEIIKKLLKIAEQNNFIGKRVLDLACGSGEVTSALLNFDHEIIGLDPYTADLYNEKTSNKVLRLSFKDIILGKLNQKFDTIVCSFALHLCDISMLPNLLWRLSEISNILIVITPHKRPDCDMISSWLLVDEILMNRVRMRIYFK